MHLSDASITERLNSLCKPPGSLGDLERLAFALCRIQNRITPQSAPRRVVVFAGDHGVNVHGVSAWPSEVTSAVVGFMATGRTASGVLAKTTGADYRVIDVGCLVPPRLEDSRPVLGEVTFVRKPVRLGTADLKTVAAMSESEFDAAWEVGVMEAALAAEDDIQIVAVGEMGIGNTTSAACLVTLLTGQSVETSVGRGAGIDDHGLETKREVVRVATSRVASNVADQNWKAIACEVAGFEIVAMAGFYAGAAQRKLTIILDGYVATAAALVAEKLAPGTSRSMIAAHQSAETGHAKALESLGLQAFLNWNMRLGEATGAILLFPMIDAAAAMMNEMATLDDLLKQTTESA